MSGRSPEERLQQVFASSRLFRTIPPECLEALNPLPLSLLEGQLLFQEGDAAKLAYVIESGILGLFNGPLSPSTAWFRKVVRGDLVGEYGLLGDEPRSASAIALTDLNVFGFNLENLRQLLSLSEELQSLLITTLADAASIGRDPRRSALGTILIHNASPDSPLTQLVLEGLPEELISIGAGAISLGEGPLVSPSTNEADLHLALTQATGAGMSRVFLTQAPELLSSRNQKLLDRLVILTDGTADHIQIPDPIKAECILVRLWPSDQERPCTKPWCGGRRVSFVLNVRAGQRSHLQRLARTVLRRQNVLVLGGGGARGFAHVGTIAALQDCKALDIDMVMGVSIGALVSSLTAFDLKADEILGHLERVIIRSRPYSLILPRQSLFSLANSERELRAFFGPSQVEDSWLVLQCFSTNLSTNQLQAWTSGDIPTAVLASMSVPGIFPPVEDATGHLHVDGGILNNLPIAPARALTDGRIIAVSLDVEPDSANNYGPDRQRRRPSLAKTLINAMMCASHSTSQSQERLADLVLRPEIGHIPFLEWKSYLQSFEAGYKHARENLSSWSAREAVAKPPSLASKS